MSELENCCGTTCDKSALAEEISKLQKRNAELVAQVEQLRLAYKTVSEKINDIDDTETDSEEIVDALWQSLFTALREGYTLCESTPSQCLAEHDRDVAARAAYNAFLAGASYPDEVYFCDAPASFKIGADNYANKIKSGEV